MLNRIPDRKISPFIFVCIALVVRHFLIYPAVDHFFELGFFEAFAWDLHSLHRVHFHIHWVGPIAGIIEDYVSSVHFGLRVGHCKPGAGGRVAGWRLEVENGRGEAEGGGEEGGDGGRKNDEFHFFYFFLDEEVKQRIE